MTDEERQKLVNDLRIIAALRDPFRLDGKRGHLEDAAREIERLAEENRKLKKSLHHMSSARETDMETAE